MSTEASGGTVYLVRQDGGGAHEEERLMSICAHLETAIAEADELQAIDHTTYYYVEEWRVLGLGDSVKPGKYACRAQEAVAEPYSTRD